MQNANTFLQCKRPKLCSTVKKERNINRKTVVIVESTQL